MSWNRSARIAIKTKHRILLLDPADIISVEAMRNYVVFCHKTGTHIIRQSISTIEDKLKVFGFVRIHRSSVVNASFVEEIQPLSTGEYALRMKGGKKYTVTRMYRSNLQLMADSWIGSDDSNDT